MFKSCSVFHAAKKTCSAPAPPSHQVAKISFYPPSSKKNSSSSLSLSYLQTQQLPLLVSMVNEQQSSIFTANRKKFESITVTFVLPEKTQPQGNKGNSKSKKDSSSSSSSVTLKMRDQIEHFNNENNNTMNDDETAAESSSNRKVIRSLLLFHGTGGSTEKGTPNKENFLEFSNFSTSPNSTTISKSTTKQQVISDRVFLTPSLNLAYDFASSSNQQKTVFAFQVDFFSKDALPVVSEYGPVSIAEEEDNDDVGRTKSRKNNNNNKDELVFLEDRYNSSSSKEGSNKAICYSYVHPDTYQPCFALLRDGNNNGDDYHQSLKTKTKKTSGTNSKTNSPSSSYRVRCVGFVDFNPNGKK